MTNSGQHPNPCAISLCVEDISKGPNIERADIYMCFVAFTLVRNYKYASHDMLTAMLSVVLYRASKYRTTDSEFCGLKSETLSSQRQGTKTTMDEAWVIINKSEK